MTKVRVRKKPEATNPCGCGCGAMVVKRFKPGHDMKLKSQHKLAQGVTVTIARFNSHTCGLEPLMKGVQDSPVAIQAAMVERDLSECWTIAGNGSVTRWYRSTEGEAAVLG